MIERGFTPGIVGDVTALHGRYYAETWSFTPNFEIGVAEELARFFAEYDPARDVALWTARYAASSRSGRSATIPPKRGCAGSSLTTHCAAAVSDARW